MAEDKNFEGGIPIGSGFYPRSDGYFLMRAEDVQVGENKSLAEYISESESGDSNDLPTYTEADNGKFLRIVNGLPTWVTIEDGDEEEY